MNAQRQAPRPGLAKTRAAPLLRRRLIQLVAASEGAVRDLFDAADVVSEGSAREEGGRLVYYGSTSLLLVPPDPTLLAELARVLPHDPHTRARALRVAHREATARAGGTLDTVHAEISCCEPKGGARPALALTVDVTAVVLRRGARSGHG